MEIWLKIKNDDGDDSRYEVSNEGRIRNTETGRYLKGRLNKKENGYYRVNVSGKDEYVHRLVAKAFYDCDQPNLEVNHIDGDKTNNHLSNLEWVTHKENIDHAFNVRPRAPFVKSVVCCGFCKYRGQFDICDGQDDSFFCAFGQR